jgi:uroporphyrinogen decarboxylase
MIMRKYHKKYTTAEGILELTKNREPNFRNFLKVLDKAKPDRPVLYEFGMGGVMLNELTGRSAPYSTANPLPFYLWSMEGHKKAGQDYLSLTVPRQILFPRKEHEQKKSISLNATGLIHDRKSFDSYPWPEAKEEYYWYYKELDNHMLPGMKSIPRGPAGVLENAITIMGYDNLCYSLYDDRQLVEDVIERIGTLILKHFKIVSRIDNVGAIIVNDDCGFNTQTFISAEHMRKYILPWHKEFVDAAHAAGKPAMLHCCGNVNEIMDDLIDVVGYDGKHSYEDNIIPVEKAYDLWGERIAIIGGIDMNFLCISSPEEVFERASAILDKTSEKGSYALGTGNSLPDYLPKENYYAMIAAGLMD